MGAEQGLEAVVDVVGVGNAMVDVITRSTDEFVAAEGLEKNSMTLIDEATAVDLYSRMGQGLEASGGSAANTMAGIASFGGTSSYIGKVSNDQLGDVFAHDMRAVGVSFDMPRATTGPATGRCLILVTPDAQRTMSTFLGVSSFLEPVDVQKETAQSGKLLFCEGYLWDIESAKAAIRLALKHAHDAGRRTALTLSDTFCVERNHSEFRELVAGPVDIVFANEAELFALYGAGSLDEGLECLRSETELGCVTLGKKGSILVTETETIPIVAEEIAPVIDTTGAGDQYAAGVLFGLARGFDLVRCGYLGSLAAAEVISHVGPRPERSLAELAELA